MGKGQLIGVEAQTPDGVGPRPVLLVPRHGAPLLLHMHPDLVLPPRLDGDIQQGVPAPRLHDLVAGDGLLGPLPRRAGKAQMGVCLHQEGADGVLGGLGHPLHHRQIAPPCDNLVPPGLEQLLGLGVPGEHQHPGRVPVQAVEHENPVVHPPGLHVVGDQVVGGAGFLLVIGHAQQLGGLVHHDQVLVLIEDGEGQGVRLGGGGGQYGYLLPRQQRRVEPGQGHPVHRHETPGQQGLHVVPALALYAGQQEGEERVGLGYGVDGGLGLPASVGIVHMVT